VTTRQELEALSSEELHDRATRHALRHANVKFFWRLMEALPVAEAAVGEYDEAHDDIQSLYGRLDDLRDSGKGEVADALRPLYIEYLLEHPDA
jgi:proline dehydrogenase